MHLAPEHDALKRSSSSVPRTDWVPWAVSSLQVGERLGTTLGAGLEGKEVHRRQQRFGLNQLHERKSPPAWQILIHQFRSLIIALLALAAGLSFFFEDWLDGAAITVVIVLNALIGFFTEWRAVQSMDALKTMSRTTAKVRRDALVRQIFAEELVPGDLAVFGEGDIVSADVRLHQCSKLQVDESSLTGESLPVTKQPDPLPAETVLHDRSNMLFKGTVVTRGSAEGIVIATGMQTELGRITSLVAEAEQETTPLERRLDQLGRKLIWLTLAVSLLVVIAGLLGGRSLLLMVDTGIALAVAAIPEGLPIVTTIALAKGVSRMARRNALVRRLSAVETLGSTSLVLTDKTGTLTENRMTVTRLALASYDIEVDAWTTEDRFTANGTHIDANGSKELREALETAVMCNNADLQSGGLGDHESAVGDPLEIGLLIAGAKAEIYREQLVRRFPEVREEAFERETKMMATIHRATDGFRVVVKGAPEAVLERCTHVFTEAGDLTLEAADREQWYNRNIRMAEAGLRVLALARKHTKGQEEEAYGRLALVGLVGITDPPRKDVRRAIAACHKAGVDVVMITGDQPMTARRIAQAVGLSGDADTLNVVHGKDLRRAEDLSDKERERVLRANIFARVTPEQKLDVVRIQQSTGRVVAMTGDGVNDAPALKKADIGVAMGKRGTQVAREAADMVLTDDSFGTIVEAIELGRGIFSNVRKFLLFLLSCNLSEILVIGLGTVTDAPLPILPLQILFLNLLTDVFPALALGMGPGDRNAMEKPPRGREEPFFRRGHWIMVVVLGLAITLATLSAFFLALYWLRLGPRQAVTVAFLTLAIAQLLNVFNMREPDSDRLRNEITANPFVWASIALCSTVLLIAFSMPVSREVLSLSIPQNTAWALIVVMSVVPLLFGQLLLRSKAINGSTWAITRDSRRGV